MLLTRKLRKKPWTYTNTRKIYIQLLCLMDNAKQFSVNQTTNSNSTMWKIDFCLTFHECGMKTKTETPWEIYLWTFKFYTPMLLYWVPECLWRARLFLDKFGFINRVDNMNWPHIKILREIFKCYLCFRANHVRLTMETLAWEYLYDGQFTILANLMTQIYFVIPSNNTAPQFLYKLTPYGPFLGS